MSSPIAVAGSRGAAQRRIVTVLACVQVIGGLGAGAGLALGSLLVRDITGSPGLAGLATVMLTAGAAAATMPLAAIALRSGRRPALALGWLVGALGAAVTIAGAVAESAVVVLAGLFLTGVNTAANLQSRFAAADRARPDQVGRSVSLVVWATTVGAVIGPNLTGPGAALARALAIPELAGPLVFAVAGFGLAALLTAVALRPEPLADPRTDRGKDRPRLGAALPQLRGPAQSAVLTSATAHAVMVGVMALTPVHMASHGASLRVIGLTISLHIAGMFALSPVMGWLADRWGAERTILLGQTTLIAAVAVAGSAGGSELRTTTGLVLLGIGWSASVIAAAALLTRSVDTAVRPAAQGVSDLLMNLAGAAGGLLAGVVIAWQGYAVLNVVAGLLTLPVIIRVLGGHRSLVPRPSAYRSNERHDSGKL